MAFANELPWHGLGNRVDSKSTVDQMLKAAGLNWKVNLHQCKIEVGGKLRDVTGKFALVRETDNRVLTMVGPNWKPLQNKDALEFFREYTEVGGATLETAGSLRGGKIVWGLAKLAAGFKLPGGDQVNGYLLLISPHEVGHKISARTTTVRVVCANTMALALRSHSQAYFAQNHLKDFDVEQAKATIGIANEEMVTAAAKAKKLQKLKMSEMEHLQVLARHFQPEMAETKADVRKLMDDPTLLNKKLAEVLVCLNKAPGAAPGNAWGTLNAVTYWTDHMVGRSVDARMTNAWLGPNAKLKLDVEAELLEMAA